MTGVGFLSDLVTALIGVATIYAFIRYRKRVSGALRLIRLNHLNDRRAEIKQTLELLDQTPIAKGRAIEVRALFGRLNGQVMPLCSIVPELSELQQIVHKIAHENGKLNEPIKQQVIHQMHAQFERARYKSLDESAGEEK